MKDKVINFGKFKLLKQIARGGMAEIFLGCSGNLKSAHKFLVVKRILSVHSHNKEFNKMFQNEGKIVVNLTHSNICSIYEFGIENNQYFICMEYISGRNLRQLVKKLKSQKKTLNPAMCAHIIRYVCNGLDYAHSCMDSITGQPLNIIHRDISPQNIMISFGGDVKVIDFGIAKVDDSESTKAGVLKGKFEYMSPEQVRGKELDRQTDIFSLGNILWELLASRKLFRGSNEIQLLKKIKSCELPDLKKINPQVPDKLVEIVNKSLSSNKNLRYKNMGEMSNDISVFLNKAYSDFTHTNFSSFIKEVYIEEILEERQNLKKYSQLLALGPSAKKGFSRQQSSPSYRVSEFIGYSESSGGKTKREDNGKQESTANFNKENSQSFYGEDSLTNNTKQASYTQTMDKSAAANEEITKTKFEDQLYDRNNFKSASQQYTIVSDGYRNTISEVSKESSTFVTKDSATLLQAPSSQAGGSKVGYQPWQSTKRQLKPSQLRRRKKSLVRRAIVGLSICGCIGAAYVYRSEIKNQIVNIQEQLNLNKKTTEVKKQVQASDAEQTPNIEKKSDIERANAMKAAVPAAVAPVSRQVNSIEQKVAKDNAGLGSFNKNILINTQPSGAQLYINGKKIDTVTPTSIMVPIDERFELIIRRVGYYDHKIALYPKEIKETVKFRLKKKKRSRTRNKVLIMQ